MIKKLFGNDKILIEYYPAEDWIYADWIGAQSEQDIRHGGVQMIAAMKEAHKKHRCTKVLNDNRRVKGVWGHSVEWATQDWLPTMVDSGLKSFAWILSKEALTNLAGLRLRIRANEQNTDLMSAHSDIDEAKKWLHSRPR